VILIFLHDWKHTIIVLCAIPTSLINSPNGAADPGRGAWRRRRPQQ